MVYVRYIKKKNGTLVGPYLYKSVRKEGKVVGQFVKKISTNEVKNFKNKKEGEK